MLDSDDPVDVDDPVGAVDVDDPVGAVDVDDPVDDDDPLEGMDAFDDFGDLFFLHSRPRISMIFSRRSTYVSAIGLSFPHDFPWILRKFLS